MSSVYREGDRQKHRDSDRPFHQPVRLWLDYGSSHTRGKCLNVSCTAKRIGPGSYWHYPTIASITLPLLSGKNGLYHSLACRLSNYKKINELCVMIYIY